MIVFENAVKQRKNLNIIIEHLEIPQGMITMIVSRNSGGKSTLLKILSGALSLDEGTVSINGLEISEYKKNNTIFYMPDTIPANPRMTVFRSTDLYEGLYENFEPREFEINLVKANIPLHLKIEELSKGQQKKYMFELMKLSGGKMLLLDEPTNGLDEKNKVSFKKNIQNYLIEENNYVVIASNNVEDIEMICDCMIYIKDGMVFFQGTPIELQERYKIWTGNKDSIPTRGVVGIKKKRHLVDVLIDTHVNNTEIVSDSNLHDILILLERGAR